MSTIEIPRVSRKVEFMALVNAIGAICHESPLDVPDRLTACVVAAVLAIIEQECDAQRGAGVAELYLLKTAGMAVAEALLAKDFNDQRRERRT